MNIVCGISTMISFNVVGIVNIVMSDKLTMESQSLWPDPRHILRRCNSRFGRKLSEIATRPLPPFKEELMTSDLMQHLQLHNLASNSPCRKLKTDINPDNVGEILFLFRYEIVLLINQ